MRYLFLILFLNCAVAQAQVTNVEGRRVKTDTIGWYGEVNTGFKFVKEVGNVFTSNSDARIQYKTDKNLYLALGEYNWSGARGRTYTHNAYLHLRYNRKLKPSWLRWEIFTQAQFNKITRINLRMLTGTGPRFKLLEKEKTAIYLGVLYMFEHSKETDKEEHILYRNEHRKSSYLSFSVFPTEQLSVISTTYYQPRIDKWSDYRISNASELRAKITKRLFMSMVYKFNFDAFPAEGIAKVTHSFENKLGLVF